MIDPITSATQADPASAGESAAPSQQSAQPQTKLTGGTNSAATDTVTLSASAQAAQEVTETQAQTAKEARSGDHQAQRLLAKEAAAKKAQQ
jgi:hypothetical protein